MNIKRILAAAVAAVFIAGAATSAYAAEPLKRNKKALETENKALQTQLDSIRRELEKYKTEARIADSLAIAAEEAFESSRPICPEEYTTEVSDSLLDIWYAHKMTEVEEEIFDMDSVRFESNVPDSVYIERLKRMNSFITLPFNDIVKNYIIKYSEKMPTGMAHILGLCEYYMPIFEAIFDKYEMPEELKAMAIIESALNPLAVSRVGAKGMWQFMYDMAKHYGLHINSFVDERYDPIKSAEAAAKYLKDSYAIFGDWNLAIASYNCGAGNVRKAIRRAGGSRNFWDIWPYLPRETRGYVPAFVGALYTVNYYKEHGIKPEAVGMPVAVDTFVINKQLHLQQVSDLTKAPLEELRKLNPQYRHNIIPGNEREYILRIPYIYTNAFIDCEDTVYTHKTDVYFNPVTIKKIKEGDGERITYRVQSGDYLGKIASKYRVTVSQIKRWNNLKSNDIRVGQRLTIYRGGGGPSASTSSSSSSSSSSTVKETPKPAGNSAANATGHSTYTVKSGDSFYSIAKNYPGVSAQNIIDYNGLTSSSLKPGMVLKIPIF